MGKAPAVQGRVTPLSLWERGWSEGQTAAKATLALLSLAFMAAGAGAEPLDWEACVREALGNNPDLIAAREAVRSARAGRGGSFTPFLPQLSADGSAGRSGPPGSDSHELSLTGRQSLFAGGRDKAGLDQARAELSGAEADGLAAEAQVFFNLRSAFARLLYAQEQIALTETIAARRGDNVRLVELRYEAGREHKGSYLRIRAARRQAEFEVSQARRARRVAQRELARAMGRAKPEDIAVAGELGVPPPPGLPDFDALSRQTPDVLSAEAGLRSARAGATAARSGFLPELSAAGSVGRRGSTWPPASDRWSFGLSLSYPFFPGGRNVFDLRGARADERRAESGLASALQGAALGLEDAFAAYEDAAERTSVQNEFLEAARVRAEIARGQYTNGLLSFEDWDLIENDLIANQKTHLASRRDAVVAQAAWGKAQGKGLAP